MARLDPRPLEDFSMWAMLQRGGKDPPWDNLDRVKMGILCEAVALVLSGDLDRLEALKDD